MITQIRLIIDHTKDGELSTCMELPDFIRSIDESAVLATFARPFPAMHVNGVIKHILDDEVNFYKLLKRVLLGKK